jgi:chromosome segregation ATPase
MELGRFGAQTDFLEVSMATPDIKRAFRGVDTGQVDDVIRSMTNRIETLELSISERRRSIDRLKGEIADPTTSTPSFAKLGSVFEETLRNAEDKARRMRAEAAAETAAVTNKTDWELQNLSERTERQTREIVVSAQSDANEILLQVEREVAATAQQIADERARMEIVASRAERTSASMISQTEQQISDTRAAAYREISEIKRQAADMVREASDNKVETETRIGLEVAAAQAQSTAVHDEADAYAQQSYEQAIAHVESAIATAAALKQEADDHLRAAQIRAAEILQDSRSLVQKSISDALTRSHDIARSSEEFFTDFVFDAEASITEIQRNTMALSQFEGKIRDVSNEVNVDAIEQGATSGRRPIQQAEIVEGDK